MPSKRANAATSQGGQAAAGEPTARERILTAAGQLFAERGFDRTPTARIAAKAGVPHGGHRALVPHGSRARRTLHGAQDPDPGGLR